MPSIASKLCATTGACLRAAAAVFALAHCHVTEREDVVERLVPQRARVDIDPAAASASGLTRMKSGAFWGGTAWSISKSCATVLDRAIRKRLAECRYFTGAIDSQRAL